MKVVMPQIELIGKIGYTSEFCKTAGLQISTAGIAGWAQPLQKDGLLVHFLFVAAIGHGLAGFA